MAISYFDLWNWRSRSFYPNYSTRSIWRRQSSHFAPLYVSQGERETLLSVSEEDTRVSGHKRSTPIIWHSLNYMLQLKPSIIDNEMIATQSSQDICIIRLVGRLVSMELILMWIKIAQLCISWTVGDVIYTIP